MEHQVFVDPAQLSSGIYIRSEDDGVLHQTFLNVTQKAPKASDMAMKFRCGWCMSERIVKQVVTQIKSLNPDGYNKVDWYVEAPFVGMFSSTLNLASVGYFLYMRILQSILKDFHKEGHLYVLSASLVGGRDRSAKRTRKERKPFAIRTFDSLYGNSPNIQGRAFLNLRAQDDVATAFLFWFFIFHEPTKKVPSLKEIPVEYLYADQED